MDTVKLGGFANYSADKLAALTFHSPRTARRWIAENLAPRIVVEWLALTHGGDLSAMDKLWAEWRLFRGELHAPNGWHFTPGELLSLPLLYQEIAALKKALSDRPPQLDLFPAVETPLRAFA